MHEKTHEPVITLERILTLTNCIIDHMLNDAGGHIQEVIETLSDLGFTAQELIEVFSFNEADVSRCLPDTHAEDTEEEAQG